MTTEKFDNTKWRPGMKAVYKGNVYTIIGVDFEAYTVILDVSSLCDVRPHFYSGNGEELASFKDVELVND